MRFSSSCCGYSASICLTWSHRSRTASGVSPVTTFRVTSERREEVSRGFEPACTVCWRVERSEIFWFSGMVSYFHRLTFFNKSIDGSIFDISLYIIYLYIHIESTPTLHNRSDHAKGQWKILFWYPYNYSSFNSGGYKVLIPTTQRYNHCLRKTFFIDLAVLLHDE